MNGVGTGFILIGLGLVAFLPPYLMARKGHGQFVEPSMIGGYNGPLGLACMGIGVLIVWISALVLLYRG